MTSLKPCPFCGDEATVERIGKSGYYYVACNTAYCCDFGKFDTEAEAIEAWNTRATHGTLTAEQVCEAAYAHSIHADCADADWQAIADELNATLGGGECKVVASSTDGLTTDNPKQWFELSCGHTFKLYGLDVPVACPVCGKAVKR